MKCPECGGELECMATWGDYIMLECNNCLSTWRMSVESIASTEALERYYFG